MAYVTGTVARVVLGLVFLILGFKKVAEPVEFLRQLHAYELVSNTLLLNVVAAVLPWMEMFVGLLLLLGLLVRECAIISLGMLLVFTAAVTLRAAAMHADNGLGWCSIRFDCGCGTGEVGFCEKLFENLLLIACSVVCLSSPTCWKTVWSILHGKIFRG